MKRIIIFIRVFALIVSGIIIYMMKKGHDLDSILNMPNKIDLRINCSEVENLLLASTVTVYVNNTSNRVHEDVVVRITGYDDEGIITKQKEITLIRTLQPKGEINRPITLPAKQFLVIALL